MKVLFKWVLRLAVAFVCCLTVFHFYSRWCSAAQQRPGVALVGQQAVFADFSVVRAKLEEDGYEVFSFFTDSPDEAIDALSEKDIRVVVLQPGTLLNRSSAEKLQQKQLAVFLLGDGSTRIYDYDKSWGLAARVTDAGEQLGAAVSQAFQSGAIPDFNENQFLDYISYSDETDLAIATALLECEHYGLYLQDYSPIMPEDAAPPEDADSLAALWQKCSQPEVLLCGSAQQAEQAIHAVEQLGWLAAEAPTCIAAVAHSRQEAEHLASLKAVALIVYFDETAADADLVTMIENTLEGQFPAANTALRYDDDSGCFWLSYHLYAPQK